MLQELCWGQEDDATRCGPAQPLLGRRGADSCSGVAAWPQQRCGVAALPQQPALQSWSRGWPGPSARVGGGTGDATGPRMRTLRRPRVSVPLFMLLVAVAAGPTSAAAQAPVITPSGDPSVQ